MTEKNNRWYDFNPIVADAVHAWEHFPPPLQRALALHLKYMIKKRKLPFRYKGLGRLFVYCLIAIDNRKHNRWCDKDKVVQNIFNTLPHIELAPLIQTSLRVVLLRKYVREKPIDAQNLSEGELLKTIAYVFDNPNHV